MHNCLQSSMAYDWPRGRELGKAIKLILTETSWATMFVSADPQHSHQCVAWCYWHEPEFKGASPHWILFLSGIPAVPNELT
jgi:hypothetical protein